MTRRSQLSGSWSSPRVARSPSGRVSANSSGSAPRPRRSSSAVNRPTDEVRLWDPTTGNDVATLGGRGGFLRPVYFSPDGAYMAAHSREGRLRVWDLTAKIERKSPPGKG